MSSFDGVNLHYVSLCKLFALTFALLGSTLFRPRLHEHVQFFFKDIELLIFECLWYLVATSRLLLLDAANAAPRAYSSTDAFILAPSRGIFFRSEGLKGSKSLRISIVLFPAVSTRSMVSLYSTSVSSDPTCPPTKDISYILLVSTPAALSAALKPRKAGGSSLRRTRTSSIRPSLLKSPLLEIDQDGSTSC